MIGSGPHVSRRIRRWGLIEISSGEALRRLFARPVLDSTGRPMGHVCDVLTDAVSEAVDWFVVCIEPERTHPVPLSVAQWERDSISIPYEVAIVLASPQVGKCEPLDVATELALRAYWNAVRGVD